MVPAVLSGVAAATTYRQALRLGVGREETTAAALWRREGSRDAVLPGEGARQRRGQETWVGKEGSVGAPVEWIGAAGVGAAAAGALLANGGGLEARTARPARAR